MGGNNGNGVSHDVRRRSERNEHLILCSYASFADSSLGRAREEPPCPVRTCYQRDRDRVIHSKAFRRLKHKTQVFLSPDGDHYRTRLTHTLEVAQIARSIARALALNEDLTEAIALGHDLGHTPFGHAGERALEEISGIPFRHNENSLRIVEVLEDGGKGLNLTQEVRDGILCHTGSKRADTFEGRIVALSDRIAYINHDIDDACRAGILTNDDIPSYISNVLGKTHSDRITTLVSAVIDHGVENGIGMSEPYGSLMNDLRTFMFQRVYTHPIAKSEDDKVMQMIAFLYTHFCHNPDSIPGEYRKYIETDGVSRVAADYIAGMTDRFAIGCFEELFVPRVWSYK